MVKVCPCCGYDLTKLVDFEIDDFRYEAKRGLIFYQRQPLALTPSEFSVLITVLRLEGRIMHRGAIPELLGYEGLNLIGDVYITTIRNKLRAIDPNAMPLATVYGRGVRLERTSERPAHKLGPPLRA